MDWGKPLTQWWAWLPRNNTGNLYLAVRLFPLNWRELHSLCGLSEGGLGEENRGISGKRMEWEKRC